MSKPSKQTVAEFIKYSIGVSGKLQREIASEIGYDKPNMITMIKKGMTPLPLDKIGPMAKSLDIDPHYLFRLTLNEYYPRTYEAIKPLVDGLLLTEEEIELISDYRKMNRDERKVRITKFIMQSACTKRDQCPLRSSKAP